MAETHFTNAATNVGNFIGNVIKKTDNTIDSAVNTVTSTAGNIKNGVTDTITGIKEGIGEVIDKTTSAAGSAVNVVKDTAANIKETVSNTVDEVTDFMENPALHIMGTAATIYNSAINTINKPDPENKVPANDTAAETDNSNFKYQIKNEAKYYMPSIGGYIEKTEDYPTQLSPLLNTYSPRLFGAPPQLTSLNDIRLLSSTDGNPGPVGDFYLTKILQDSQVVNFVVGKALFTGGMSSFFGIIGMMIKYAKAMSQYDIFGSNTGVSGTGDGIQKSIDESKWLEAYDRAYKDDDGQVKITSNTSIKDLDDDVSILDLSGNPEVLSIVDELGKSIDGKGVTDGNGAAAVVGGVGAALLTSLSVQQPFYTFESDWHSYIENVKMMINTAVIQLGLQRACIRVGDKMIPLSMSFNNDGENEPWALYSSWITHKFSKLNAGSVTGIDAMTGDTSQYVSFMIDPAGSTESFTNEVGDSQIFGTVINQGNDLGAEISFLTNASANSIDDALINIANGAVGAAESVLTAMTAGVGRFTAAVAGSMARTFIGNHTIYPQIFKNHTSTQSREISIHLNASGGDPFSYLMDILVPYFFILGMVLPTLSKNNASAYSFPPLVQCNIPGVWGTRLGMVTSVSVNKNQSGKDLSVNGYPLSIDVTMTVTDLQHTLMTSPQDRASTFLNNHTMFDYIAVCAGVDKYRPNGAMRLVSRLALAANVVSNVKSVIGNAVLSDFTSFVNRLSGVYNL